MATGTQARMTPSMATIVVIGLGPSDYAGCLRIGLEGEDAEKNVTTVA